MDLAGNEQMKSDSKETRAETRAINSGLSTLKTALIQVRQKTSVSWSASMLTRALRPLIEGGAATVVIATASPSVDHWADTKNTMAFTSQIAQPILSKRKRAEDRRERKRWRQDRWLDKFEHYCAYQMRDCNCARNLPNLVTDKPSIEPLSPSPKPPQCLSSLALTSFNNVTGRPSL